MRAARLSLVLFVVLNFSGRGQRLKFENYTTGHGLLSDNVYNLHQDRDGYLWVFSNFGTVKYNSTEFRQVLRNLSFEQSFIFCIYENRLGEKWIANSNAEIFRIRNDSALKITGADAMSSYLRQTVSEIYRLFVDEQKNIYVITKLACYKLVPKGNTYQVVNLSKQLMEDTLAFVVYQVQNEALPIFDFTEGRMQNYWHEIDSLTILFKKDSGRRLIKVPGKTIIGPKIFKLHQGNIFFSYYDRMFRLDSLDKVLKIPVGAVVMNFGFSPNGHLWVATHNHGLFEFDRSGVQVAHYFDGISVNDILFDSQGGMWISTVGEGLYHCKDLNGLYFDESDARKGAVSMMQIQGSALLIGNTKGSLWKIQNGKWTHLASENSLGEVLGAVTSGDDYLVSYKFGLRRYNAQKESTTWMSGYGNAWQILRYFNDTLIYLNRKGISRITAGQNMKQIFLNKRLYSSVMVDSGIILGTDEGARFIPRPQYTRWIADPPKTGIVYGKAETRSWLGPADKSLINSCVKDSSGAVWFCSLGHGLFKLTGKAGVELKSVKGLPSNIIYNISVSGREVLLGTNSGLYYSELGNDGMPLPLWRKLMSGAVHNALFFENKIYVAAGTDLVILDRDKGRHHKKTAFNLVDVLVNDERIQLRQLKDLSHHENTVEFRFDIISFSGDRPKLWYSLRGPVIDSGIVSGAAVKFTHLPAGEYVLAARPLFDEQQKQRIEVRLHISPPFWRKPWFIVLAVLAGGLVISGVVWLIVRRIRIRKDRQTEAERLILEYKLIALKAQINPHFMSNCLSAIQNLVINHQIEPATFYIARFGLLVRQILNFSSRSLITLQEELTIAELYVELEQLRFEHKFIFEIKTDPQINPEKVFVPALILNPLLENAIWHGLLPLKEKKQGRITLTIIKKESNLDLIIEDNGVGRATTGDGKIGNIRESKGQQLTQQRLTNINFLFGMADSIIKYEDLLDDYHAPAGTKAVISLPLNLKPIINE